MWEQIRARSGDLRIRPLREADLDTTLVDRMTVHAKQLLSDGKLHRDTDITIAVEELQPNTTEMVDAFIMVASHVAHNFGPKNLLAVVRLREWAERNRAPVMVPYAFRGYPPASMILIRWQTAVPFAPLAKRQNARLK